MAKQTWGLDLGYWSLKVARGTADPKTERIAIDLYDEIRYDELGLDDSASSLELFREGLRAFGMKYTLGKNDNLCVAVSGSEVFSRFVNLPPVPESINEIIRFEARQQIPFDIKEVVWDYQPIKDEYQPGEEIEVGLFALKRDTVAEFMEMLEPWRKNLRVIEDAPLAMYNFLRYEGRAEEPLIVLDVGAHTSDVLILNHPRFWVRPLLIAGNDITERLQSHFGVSAQESERIKARASETAHEAQVLRVIRPVVGSMISEIQRSLGYYKSLARGVKFEKVLALGSAFRLRGLDRLLAEGLQYEIERLEDVRRFDIEPPMDPTAFLDHLGGACVALGLVVQGVGLGHMNINLVPEELTTALAITRKKPWVAAAAAAVLVAGAIVLFSEKAYGAAMERMAGVPDTLQKKIGSIQQPYQKEAGKTKRLAGELSRLAGRTLARDALLYIVPKLAQELPPEVYVRDIKLSHSSLTMACEMEVVGDAPTHIAKFVVAPLGEMVFRNGEPVFGSVSASKGLQIVTHGAPGGRDGIRAGLKPKEFVKFTITASIGAKKSSKR